MSNLTDEQLMLQAAAREFAMKEVLPTANRLDPQRGEMPAELIGKLGELGYFGITLPPEYGGSGLGCLEYCIVTEELGRAWMSVASVIRPAMGVKQMSDAQKERYLPRIATGRLIGAFAMSEPGTGSDVSGLSTRARRCGDCWSITGNKYWCTFADGADFIVVIARTRPPAEGEGRHKGLSAFIVEKQRGRLPDGVQGSPIPKIGYFGWKTWELSFDDCRVPAENVLGPLGEAFYMVSSGLETARAHTAARAIGLARGALEDAIAYAQERVQFGAPIAAFQAIRFKIANMATEIEASRQLLHYVCRKIDKGERCDREAAMAKLHATEMAERVTSEALQIHGGAGYTTHHAVERYWRDARLTKIFEGTSEIQMRVISDSILGKPGRTH
ncbi:MAG: acyl-CoA dehydrogenase family protein [Burkholderiaceae bacterium]|nr:acyl-CoA dehydrogenase family protein [Burkholderiaceae bacterium]